MALKNRFAFSLNRLLAVVKKEVIQIRRDRPSLGIAVAMPLMMLFLFGYAVNTDVDHFSTVIWDQNKSQESRQLLQVFATTNYFDLNYYVGNYRELEALIDEGKAKVAIVIPPSFSKKLSRNEPADIQVLIDGTDPNIARIALSTAQLVAKTYGGRLQSQLLSSGGGRLKLAGIDAEARVLYNPEMKSLVFNIPGLIGLIMQNVTTMLTAFAMVREKERGTMEQLAVTPIRPGELIVGKLIPYVGIGLFSFTLVLVAGLTWFKVPVQGSVMLLFLLSLLFLITTLAIGLLISTLAHTQLQAMQLTFLLILPSILLSGFVFPRETMPWLIKGIGGMFPLTYFLTILRGIFLKGLSIEYLWRETLILSAFAVLLCAVAMARFQKKVD